jgi:site-specific recombinase XerD
VTHSLRDTFASHLAINGTPIVDIQKLMNHKGGKNKASNKLRILK